MKKSTKILIPNSLIWEPIPICERENPSNDFAGAGAMWR